MERKWMLGALSLLFLSSILGLWMRYIIFAASPHVPYIHILHAHSHTALLGFGFLFIMGGYLFTVLKGRFKERRFYRLGIAYFAACIGMAISFLYQSYGPVSITFSTVVMILAYIMVFDFLKAYRRSDHSSPNPLIRWSMYWFLISSIGIWVLGPSAAILGKSHELYFLSIQFFLHFQFNGWFTYAALALVLHLTHRHNSDIRISSAGIYALNISLLLTYFLSVTYVHKDTIYFILNSAGVGIQLWGFFLILKPVLRNFHSMQMSDSRLKWIWHVGLGCLLVKVLFQGLLVFPSLAEVSYSVREFIVGYIHLVLLGGATLSIAGVLLEQKILPTNKWTIIGWSGLVATFAVTEIILFGHGLTVWQGVGNALLFVRLIFFASIPFPIFIGMIVFGSLKRFKIFQV